MATKRTLSSPKTLSELVDQFQSQGRYSFDRHEALSKLHVSESAFKQSARRLALKGRIISPRHEFFIIVPVEYVRTGAPPATWFIDDLMKFQKRPYYVGLLSAAALHGAAHQQPQEFQVVSASILRPLEVGDQRIRFFHKSRIAKTPVTAVKTPTGYMQVSTPEATAFDLVRYARGAGHLQHVATVLAELSEKIDPQQLLKTGRHEIEGSVIQRTGYLLEHFGHKPVTKPLAAWLKTKETWLIPLKAEPKPHRGQKNLRWNVIVNDVLEPDV